MSSQLGKINISHKEPVKPVKNISPPKYGFEIPPEQMGERRRFIGCPPNDRSGSKPAMHRSSRRFLLSLQELTSAAYESKSFRRSLGMRPARKTVITSGRG